ncbi:MAG: WD40 repeat domain-containing protein, partial [Rhodothermales bacterium]|nr:WD40 repeat domain-containing protein [Rhodothermales bacterium]
ATQGVRFSTNGQWLIESGRDSTISLWHLATGERVQMEGGVVPYVLRGDRMAFGDRSGGVQVFDLLDDSTPFVARVEASEPIALGNNGALVTSDGALAQVWSLDSPEPILVKSLSLGSPLWAGRDVEVSHNGRFALFPGLQRHLLRDLEQLADSLRLDGLVPITSRALSGDRKTLFTGHMDGSLSRWDLSKRKPVPEQLVSGSAPESASTPIALFVISPMGDWLATRHTGASHLWRISDSALVHVEDLTTEEIANAGVDWLPVSRSFGHTNVFSRRTDFTFTEDDRWFLDRSDYERTRLLRLDGDSIQTRVFETSEEVQISSDGKWLAVPDTGDTVNVYDLDNEQATPVRLSGNVAAFKDDAVLTDCSEGRFEVEDLFLTIGGFMSIVEGESDASDGAACKLRSLRDPTGTIATLSIDDRYQMPDIGGGMGLSPSTSTLSPDKRWFVPRFSYAGYDGAGYGSDLRLMDMHAENPIATLSPLTGGAYRAIEFSDDGDWFAADSLMWDLTAPQPTNKPFPLPGMVLAFNDGGQFVLTEELAPDGEHSTIRYVPLNVETLLKQGCLVAGRNLSTDEWRRYFPGEPYRKICAMHPLPIE